jgi:hypothetical protein
LAQETQPTRPVEEAETEQSKPDETEPRARGKVESLRLWFGRQQDRYERFSKRLERFGVSPDVGTLGQGSGVAVGATYFGSNVGPRGVDLEASSGFSIRGYEVYELRIGGLDGRDGRTTLRPADAHVATQFDSTPDGTHGPAVYLDVRYRHSPLHRYFGAGPDSREADHTSFLMRGASYDLVTEYQPRRWLGLAARGGLLDLDVGAGGDPRHPSTELAFTDLSAPGLARQPRFLHLGTAVTLDGRDSAAAPRSGGMAGVMFSRFQSLGGSEEDFSRAALDARYFVPVSSRSVVALRMLTSSDFAVDSGRVPFYLQQTLGGGDTLRGFQRARFRDRSLLHVSAEYRFDVHRKLELAGFYDVGQVAPSLSAVSVGHLDRSWGAGLRLKGHRGVKFRVDLAFSREGRRLILSRGVVF